MSCTQPQDKILLDKNTHPEAKSSAVNSVSDHKVDLEKSTNWTYLEDKIFPTLPATIVVGAGFFIFHMLANRRQKHVEIFATFRDLKALIDDINDVSSKAWRSSGNDAAQDGTAADVRQKLTRAREELRLLYALDSRFRAVRIPLNEFRTSIDEALDADGLPISTIDDISRSPNIDWVHSGIAPKATAIRTKLNDTFAEIYGPHFLSRLFHRGK